MRCSRCETTYTIEDNYCRQCGSSLRIQRLPVRQKEALPARLQSNSPTLMTGATAVAAGAVGQWLMRALVRQVLSGGNGKPRKQLPARRSNGKTGDEYTVTETLVMRKVTLRR